MKESKPLTHHPENSARQILDNYLAANNHRRTPERYAILEAVNKMEGHFTLEELNKYLESIQFHVSRATLYNTMKLLTELRLVVKHHLFDSTKYEVCYAHDNHCHQICSVCGAVTEVFSQEIDNAVEQLKLKRFRKDGFSLYIYGVCSTCQTKITKRKRLNNSK